MGNVVEARPHFDEALTILRQQFPEGSPLLARALWRSAGARLENNDAAAALPELEESVSMAKNLLPVENPQLLEFRETLNQCKASVARGTTN